MGQKFNQMRKYRLTSLGKNVIILAALIIALTTNEIVKSKNIQGPLNKSENTVSTNNIVDNKEIMNSIIDNKVRKYAEPILVVNFDINVSSINPANYRSLSLLVNILKRYDNVKLEIRGYCSREPNIENDAFNQSLSYSRAESIKDYLVSKGISPHRITIGGYGYSDPIGDNSTSLGRKMNRRAEIYIKNEL